MYVHLVFLKRPQKSCHSLRADETDPKLVLKYHPSVPTMPAALN